MLQINAYVPAGKSVILPVPDCPGCTVDISNKTSSPEISALPSSKIAKSS